MASPEIPDTGEHLVRATGVHKWFGSLHALDDVTLVVDPGEVVALVGPSGSGKSTLLRCLNHLERVDAGEIIVAGHRIGYREKAGKLVEEKERRIARQRVETGMVFQNFNLFPHLTALDNITVAPIRVRGIPAPEAKELGKSLLARIGLESKASAYPRQLSGGQQQRVAIARALAMRPKLMLFDEPTSALDPEMVGEVLAVIRGLVQEGMTMIIVTHEMTFAREVADRVDMMDNGRIIEDASAKAFFEAPSNPRSRQFLSKFL
jgi:polar amino acid transport system ATP-binding protein